ncbi:MAG: glycosyltransferase [Betaproteobacteria bacterium]|nr:glycosyltransferase [Betaproteobacteria bacterium]
MNVSTAAPGFAAAAFDRGDIAAPVHAHDVSVSVIIPAFNAATSIARCLASVLSQPLAGIEIIVVDDGSADGTADAVSAVARVHAGANIRVHRQSNQGVSVARNAGLRLARGRYVMFVDADDALAIKALPRLLRRAEAERLDVLLCNAWWHDLGGGAARVMLRTRESWSGSGGAWIERQVKARQLKHYVWCQFIRREWLVGSGLRFIPGITHQDIVWTNELLLNAQRVGFDPTPRYHYWQRAGSLSQPRDSAARLNAACHYLRVAAALDALAKSRPPGPLRVALAWQTVEEGIAVLHLARRLTPGHRERLYARIQSAGHVPRLFANALTPRHRLRVLKRSARFLIWQAAQRVGRWFTGRGTPAVSAASAQSPQSQFGGD